MTCIGLRSPLSGSRLNCTPTEGLMAYRLPATALTDAVKYLCRYGDTDVFPHLPEIHFLSERIAEVVAELKMLAVQAVRLRR